MPKSGSKAKNEPLMIDLPVSIAEAVSELRGLSSLLRNLDVDSSIKPERLRGLGALIEGIADRIDPEASDLE